MSNFFNSRLQSFRCAFSGMDYVLKTQKNAWIHAVVTIVVLLLSWWLKPSIQNWAVIILTTGFVWAAECFNTTLETLFDLIHPDPHPLVKVGKDVSAAAVLISAITAIFVGLFIFGPLILQKF